MRPVQVDPGQSDLARALKLKSARTIQRRRHLFPTLYKPDYIDRTGHPRWKPETVEKIVDWEKRK
jgi:hypothetical protein